MTVKLPLVICLLALSTASCRKEGPPVASAKAGASELPAIKVDSKAKLLLTYFAGQAKGFTTVSTLKDVPDLRRGWVRVVDLAAKPAKRRDLELVYVADLRKADDKGTYPYVVMSRRAFEEAAQNNARPGATAPATAAKVAKNHTGKVILYATSWCPACSKAKKWLTDQRIAFVEKDIEKDRQAAAELMAKAQKAGIPASGVPVLDVKGTLVRGFDPRRIAALLSAGASK